MGGQFSKYEFHSESFDVFINDDFANDGKIFYADTSPPPRAPLESDTGWIRALVGCIGGLGLFIPGAGPYIFGAASVTLLGLELSDEQKRNHPNYGQLKNDYDEMEKAVHKAIHDSQEQSIKTFDISMTQMINNWDKAGHFNLADLASENTMKETWDALHRHTGDAGGTTFVTMLQALRDGFVWNDNLAQTIIIHVVTLYGFCMELECVLAANFTSAHTKEWKRIEAMVMASGKGASTSDAESIAKHKAEAAKWRKSFYQTLRDMRVFIHSQIDLTNQWMEAQRKIRREAVTNIAYSCNVGTWGGGPGSRTYATTKKHEWSFRDTYSGRTWVATAEEVNDSRDEKDYRGTTLQHSADLGQFQQKYFRKFEEHVNSHFTVLGDAIKGWLGFLRELDNYTAAVGQGIEIDGSQLLAQMKQIHGDPGKL